MKRRRGSRAQILTAFALLIVFAKASACGVCIEDKVAVTYDHEVVTRAVARHHVVVFAAIEGGTDANALARQVKAAAMRTRGVDRESVRSAAEPPAVSFALDPKVTSAEAAIVAVEKAAGMPRIKLALLRIAH